MSPEAYEDWLDLMGRGYYPPKKESMKQPKREDYELAAKAAGIVLDGLASAHIAQGVRLDDYLIRNDKGGHSIWNPLHNDGDSRRLQVACGIELGIHTVCCDVSASVSQGIYTTYYADHNNDKCEAARHAVFWLAVEIGRGMA